MLHRAQRAQLAETDELPRRETSRLWYRAGQQSASDDQYLPDDQLAFEEQACAVGHRTEGANQAGVRRNLDALRVSLDQPEPEPHPTPKAAEPEGLTGWRDAPRYCPILLLSANAILDGRIPGPILGPGTKYRILTVTEGVVCLQVRMLDGQVGMGYCNAVDLMCYEPDIMYLRREVPAGRRYTARLNLSRISQRLSGVTGSLIG